ncbi:hypothetical protein Q1695_004829 [Nippostrongylus brasiliensis]|nr:hypothetical protein Q1695_004829 [Nippostrongylus brasiliensis]
MLSLLFTLLLVRVAVGQPQVHDDVFSCFVYHPGRFLERSGTRSEGQLPSVAQCLERCIEASSMYNFICRSVMWKKDNHFCILSIYNRAQRVDQFRIAVNSDIDLYENTCTYTPEAANTVKFVSDWDLERTTVPVPPLRNVTPRPRTPPSKKPMVEEPLRRAREEPYFSKNVFHKRQGIGTTNWFSSLQYDAIPPIPQPKPLKPRNELHAKTFSVPLNQPDIVVDAQVDDEGRSLFNLPSSSWRLPPIRRGPIARHFYANTVTGNRLTTNLTKHDPADTITITATLVKPTKKPSPTIVVDGVRERPVVKAASRPCFMRKAQRYLVGFEERTMNGTDLNGCFQGCLQATAFYCASVNYSDKKKLCTLNGGNLHLNDVQLQPSKTFDYYENQCNLDQNSRKVSNMVVVRRESVERCFTVHVNTILLSLESRLLEKAASLDHCQSECLKSSGGGWTCGALNWVPHNKGCMLFEVGYDKRLVVPNSHTQFAVNKCAGQSIRNATTDADEYYDDYPAEMQGTA